MVTGKKKSIWKQRMKGIAKTVGVELVGSVFIAVGIYNFAAASHFPMTGFSGIALILNRLFQCNIGISIIVMNLPVAILCYRLFPAPPA